MNIKDQGTLNGAEQLLFNQYLEQADEGFNEAKQHRLGTTALSTEYDLSEHLLYN